MIKQLRKLYWNVATRQLDGIGVIEVILILVIIIGLIAIFREQITDIIQQAFDNITGDSTTINTPIDINNKK